MELLRRLVGDDIRIEVDPSPRPVRVRADAGGLGQVLLNLTVNARDAMPRGGILRIEILPTDPGSPSPMARLVVSDNGTGMSPEVRDRIFEPFYTTRHMGSGTGTGLGLATVHGVVEQSGGRIEVESAPGRGSRFTIALPAVEPEP